MNDPVSTTTTLPAADTTLRCLVYILRGGRGDYSVGYTTKSIFQNGQVVYLREFADPIDALGHKLFLEQLSATSLRRIARQHPAGPQKPRHPIKTENNSEY